MLINIIEDKGLNRSASPGILNREKKAITANPIIIRAKYEINLVFDSLIKSLSRSLFLPLKI